MTISPRTSAVRAPIRITSRELIAADSNATPPAIDTPVADLLKLIVVVALVLSSVEAVRYAVINVHGAGSIPIK